MVTYGTPRFSSKSLCVIESVPSLPDQPYITKAFTTERGESTQGISTNWHCLFRYIPGPIKVRPFLVRQKRPNSDTQGFPNTVPVRNAVSAMCQGLQTYNNKYISYTIFLWSLVAFTIYRFMVIGGLMLLPGRQVWCLQHSLQPLRSLHPVEYNCTRYNYRALSQH